MFRGMTASDLQTFRRGPGIGGGEPPVSPCMPAGGSEVVWRGRKARFASDEVRLWLERMAGRGWTGLFGRRPMAAGSAGRKPEPCSPGGVRPGLPRRVDVGRCCWDRPAKNRHGTLRPGCPRPDPVTPRVLRARRRVGLAAPQTRAQDLGVVGARAGPAEPDPGFSPSARPPAVRPRPRAAAPPLRHAHAPRSWPARAGRSVP